ncbi:uncharacterized protein M6B38_317275 [Iris pallida]|uniref:Uncharacterized protein n=1 Tax=Iris pallida TaxID=29817 RepID=A0AAX6HEM8_IRIPA|nr:uncharacterized protein M6B38_317275 [Iris pallida]
MPFPVKIHPASAASGKIPTRSRLKRLFEKKRTAGEPEPELEPEPTSTVDLDRMLLSFMEGSNGGRRRCNCFNGNYDESSDDDFDDDPPPIAGDAAEILKGLSPCESAAERNLLADVSRIVEQTNKNKVAKSKSELITIVAESLRSLGLDASVCRSRWEKTPKIPAGVYDYVDVIVGADRFILDVDFVSEFEIARSTKGYRSLLQSLPPVFVGRPDRVERIVAVVSDAARASLKKKGLHVPPWRRAEYMRAKWLSPYARLSASAAADGGAISSANFSGGFEMRKEREKITVVVSPWRPPLVRPRSPVAVVVTGLSSVLTEKPRSLV